MAVPADVQPLHGGQRYWTKSLRTTDPPVAEQMRAELIARHTAEAIELSEQDARLPLLDGMANLDRALAMLAIRRGSLDAAMREQLQFLCDTVCGSWAIRYHADVEWRGRFPICGPDEEEAAPGLDTDAERQRYRLRLEFLEGRGLAGGLVHQDSRPRGQRLTW